MTKLKRRLCRQSSKVPWKGRSTSWHGFVSYLGLHLPLGAPELLQQSLGLKLLLHERAFLLCHPFERLGRFAGSLGSLNGLVNRVEGGDWETSFSRSDKEVGCCGHQLSSTDHQPEYSRCSSHHTTAIKITNWSDYISMTISKIHFLSNVMKVQHLKLFKLRGKPPQL